MPEGKKKRSCVGDLDEAKSSGMSLMPAGVSRKNNITVDFRMADPIFPQKLALSGWLDPLPD